MWEVKYHPEAEKELSRLDGSVKKIVLAGILKVSQNPLPQSEGGYGKPLGKKQHGQSPALSCGVATSALRSCSSSSLAACLRMHMLAPVDFGAPIATGQGIKKARLF